jgi:RimJ/RimL family protein N-acetyltransferase
MLHDGREVVLRRMRPDDANRLVELHGRLSVTSRYFRFFSSHPHLSRTQAVSFAAVDFEQRVAMVAAVWEEAIERIVAVGRFDVVRPDAAEFALVVRDDYQRIGLGTALFRCLIHIAIELGIDTLVAIVLPENVAMLHLAERNGAQRVHQDSWEVGIEKRLRPAS